MGTPSRSSSTANVSRQFIVRNCRDTFTSVIAGQLSSGAWTGPFFGRLEYELDIVEGWAKDPDPVVREFARGVVKGLKERLKQQNGQRGRASLHVASARQDRRKHTAAASTRKSIS